MTEKVICTMVFEVDRSIFKSMNPLTTETPWGIPYAIALGDALEEGDKMREVLEHHRIEMSSNYPSGQR